MGPLGRLAVRDLRRFRAQAIGTALLAAVVVAVAAGGARARRALVATRDAVEQRLALADLEFRFAPVPPEALRGAAAVPGVAQVEARLLAPGSLAIAGRKPQPAILMLLPEEDLPRLSALAVVEGRAPRAGEAGAILDRSLRDLSGARLGDRIEVRAGGEARSMPVLGFALFVEYLAYPYDPEIAVPIRGTVAVAAVSPAAVEGVRDVDRVDSLLVRLAPGANPDAVAAAVPVAVEAEVREVIRREEAPDRAFTDILLRHFDVYSPAIGWVFVLVGGLLLALVLARLERRRRREVGILLALGHRPSRIASTPLLLALAVGGGGALVGLLLHLPASEFLAAGFSRWQGFPPTEDPGWGAEAPLAAAACVALGLLAAALPAALSARGRPAEALRAGGGDLASRAPRWTARAAARLAGALRLPASVALGVGRVARRGIDTAASTLGLGVAFGAALAFLSVHESNLVEVRAVATRWARDGFVRFVEPAAPPLLAKIEGATGLDAEALVARVGVVERSDGATRRVPLFGVETDGLGRTLPIESGGRLSAPDADESLVDRFLAEREGWAAGDRITLYPHPDAPEGRSVEIAGILAGASMGRIVVPIGVARGLYGLGDRSTGALLEGAVTREAEDRITSWDGIESVRATAGVVARVEDSFRGNLALLWAAFGAAVAAALLFLGVLALLEADERAPEVALLEALGWRERSIFSALAAEVGTRCLLAVLLAAALAPLLAAWLRARIAAGSGYVLPAAGTDGPTLLALGGAVLATLLAAVPAHLATRRTGPGERLRLLARE